MFTRRSLTLLLACSLFTSAGAALARGGGGDDRDGAKVEGTLTAVNASANPPTVTINNVALFVTAQTGIEINDRHVSLGDLEVGERTEAKYDPETRVAFKVEQGGDDDDNGGGGGDEDRPAKVEGTLTAVNDAANPPTVTINGVTLFVTNQTEIEIDERHLALADLVVGERTEAKYDGDTRIAFKVEQGDDDDGGGGGDDNDRPGKVEGTLTAVNTNADPPTVTIGQVTLNVLPGTKIEIGERHVSLSALVIGDRTEALYDPDTLNASKIEQGDDDNDDDDGDEDDHLFGNVLVANPNSGNVTFDVDADGISDLTLKTDAKTEIEIGGARISQSELGLLNGLPALVEYFPATMYAKEIKARREAPANVVGTTVAVDAENRTVQVQTRTGTSTLVVPTGADIRSGKKKISLSSIREGAKITAKTTTNGAGQKIAVRITVTGKRANRANGATVQRRGADDPAGHVRHGRGEDDGERHHRRRRGRNS